MTVTVAAVRAYLLALQDQICSALAAADGGAQFSEECWQRPEGGDGRSRILRDGVLFEQAGVNFSHVQGAALPNSSVAARPQLAGASFEALGVSLVTHPHSPYLPTSHANVRFFIAKPQDAEPIWWFGGGFDLTPYYPFAADVQHWHQVAAAACQPFGDDLYPEFKAACDRYFHLRHRDEARGVGGLFVDDLNRWPFERCFALARAIGDGYLPAYLPIIERRRGLTWGERERQFQLYRRGRYVEFNLVYDRGTLFGLQSGGRTESILMSLPPLVRWQSGYEAEAGSREAQLPLYLQPRDWLASIAPLPY